MRTAIFLGCICIAEAIRYDWFTSKLESSQNFLVVILLAMIIMDIFDFLLQSNKKK